MTKARTVKLRTATVDLDGGRRLSVSRYSDPATDRDLLTLAEGWAEDGPLPGRRGTTLELPGGALPELIEALRGLDGEEAAE